MDYNKLFDDINDQMARANVTQDDKIALGSVIISLVHVVDALGDLSKRLDHIEDVLQTHQEHHQ